MHSTKDEDDRYDYLILSKMNMEGSLLKKQENPNFFFPCNLPLDLYQLVAFPKLPD